MSLFGFHNDTISERDVDFLLMLLCGESPAFVESLLLPRNWSGARILSVIHSQTDVGYGESDITIIAERNGKKHGVLIEDKINAIAMENQCARYEQRGKIGMENGDYDNFTVFIIAPQHYLETNDEAQNYPNRLSYEEILDFVIKSSLPCREYAISILNAALYKEKAGYTKIPIRSISEFWEDLFLFSAYFSKNVDSTVQIENAHGAKSARDTWVRFKTNLSETYLYYKTNYGYIDLQFNGRAKDAHFLQQLLAGYIDEDMSWELTGKSVSLRIYGKPVDVTKPFMQFQDSLQQVFLDVARMVKLANCIQSSGVLNSVSLLDRAIIYATIKHEKAVRKGTNIPYIVHPLETAAIAASMTDDAEIIAAAVLHDTVEDTDATAEDLNLKFGCRVAAMVCADSEDKREDQPAAQTWELRKQETLDYAEKASQEEQIIILADKLSNLRAIYRDYELLGDALWERFNQKDKNKHAWYYRGIGDRLSALTQTQAYKEYHWLLDRVFSA